MRSGLYDQDTWHEIRKLVDAPNSDLFDVLSYILFTDPPKTRRDRADGVREGSMDDAEGEMKDLLLAILGAYETLGEDELASKKLGSILSARFGSVNEGKAKLGGLPAIKQAFRRMQEKLYSM